MTSRSVGRLELYWKAANSSSPLLPQHVSVSRLHTKSYKPQTICHKQTLSDNNTLLCRYSSYIVKSPFKDIKIPQVLLPEAIWETVDKFPESTAMKCGLTGRSYTYAEVQKLSLRFANSLRRAGFTRGDVIALVLPNCPEFPVITLGLLEAELVVSFINHAYTADEICHQLKDSGSVCIVTATEKLDVILSAIKKVEKATQSKPIRKIIAVDIPSPNTLASGISRFSEMITDNIDHSRKANKVQLNDLAFLPYSSGTTGLSKGVCLSHSNVLCNLLQISSIDKFEMHSSDMGQDIVLGLLPFYHIYGLTVILFNALKSGAQVITLPKFEQDSFIKTLENEKVSVMMLVPPLILFLGASTRVNQEHLAHVRHLFSGAAPLGASDMEKVISKLPPQNTCNVSQGYGMTELSPVVTMPVLPAKNLATVGAPIPSTFGKIINPDTGEALGPNQVGELCFKGPQVMLGYHNNHKATADMIDADGWLKTGDIGFYDEDSFFYVQDRLKELIKVKGFQVPPAELEEILRTHPSVCDVGVIGVPCPRSGEVPVAYVVPANKNLIADEIKAFLSEKVSHHKQVSEVIFVDSIPKSAAGKILRKELRETYKSSHNQV